MINVAQAMEHLHTLAVQNQATRFPRVSWGIREPYGPFLHQEMLPDLVRQGQGERKGTSR